MKSRVPFTFVDRILEVYPTRRHRPESVENYRAYRFDRTVVQCRNAVLTCAALCVVNVIAGAWFGLSDFPGHAAYFAVLAPAWAGLTWQRLCWMFREADRIAVSARIRDEQDLWEFTD